MALEGLDVDMSALAAAKQQLRALMKKRLAAVTPESAAAQSNAILNSLAEWPPYVKAKRLSVFLSMPSGEVQTDGIVRHALASGKKVYVPYLHNSPLLHDRPDTPARVMDMVRLRDLADYESLVPDRWGIPSIDPATVDERQRILGGGPPHARQQDLDGCGPAHGLDLMLMPGVAFDIDPASGLVRRCGHGKGFYDFFIHRYASGVAETVPLQSREASSASSMLLFGLALTEQFLPSSSASSPPTPTRPSSSARTDDGPVPSGPLDRRLDGLILGTGEIITCVEIDGA